MPCNITNSNVHIDSKDAGTFYRGCEITRTCTGPNGQFEITCPGQQTCTAWDLYMTYDQTYDCTDGACHYTFTQTIGPVFIGTDTSCEGRVCIPNDRNCGENLQQNGQKVVCA